MERSRKDKFSKIMSETVIQVENLSKQYRLGQIGTVTIRDDLDRFWARVRGKEDPLLKVGQSNILSPDVMLPAPKSNYVWALKDINFSVQQGEVLGIIGKNGAGKSTLLKILSKVTSPTTGSITITGRIASLLEVGTGFHPELSGRENIFLNGAILGMTKNEIRRKFDEIVDFSGVGNYIDTPVKRYSSGMYVRLAFAVAAHLEPEILIVDEVLAVGDAEFQKKAIGKMKEVSRGEGRTVLFVSHNMAAIQNLCEKTIVMSAGKVKFNKGNTPDAIANYLQLSRQSDNEEGLNISERIGNGLLKFTKIQLCNKADQVIDNPISGQFLKFKLYYEIKEDIKDVDVSISINSFYGENKTVLWSKLTGQNYNIQKGSGIFCCEIEKLALTEGGYSINLYSSSMGEVLDWLIDAFVLNVENGDYFGTGVLPPPTHQSVIINHKWY